MLKKTLFAISALALIAAAPNLAHAKSIKQLVNKASLADFCGNAGVDSETTATVTLPDGTKVTGTIHCEAEDVPGSEPGDDNGGITPPAAGDYDSGDDPSRDGHHAGQGNGGDDNSAPGGDGNSGSDDGPDHDQGDSGHHGDGDSGHHGEGDSGHHGEGDSGHHGEGDSGHHGSDGGSGGSGDDGDHSGHGGHGGDDAGGDD